MGKNASCSYVKTMDRLHIILKLIFALPVLDGIFYGIYRICKGKVLIGIIWIFVGAAIGWIIDIISILLKGKPTVFA